MSRSNSQPAPVEPVTSQRRFRAMVLEDEPPLAETLASAIAAEGGEARVCLTLASAKSALQETSFDVFLLDQRMPDGTGSAFFSFLRDRGILAPCIMLTGLPELSTAVELTRNGLFDYLTKPFEPARFAECLRRAVATSVLTESNLALFGIVDHSSGMKDVRRLAYQAAANPVATVLLTGETGVGKDVIARLIHQLTFQKRETSPPWICLNCSTLPADIFEAELFGAQKGAFTGANQNRTGLAEATQDGTLFLDEIAEVPLGLQAKLLQFVETGEFRRLGSTDSLRFKGRIIVATNKSLEEEVRQGRFREDLWYRLDVFRIPVPPLRERREDLPALCNALLRTLALRHQRTGPALRPNDLAVLQTYAFPGNVRELRNTLERSLMRTPAGSNWLEVDPLWLSSIRSSADASSATATVPEPERGLSPLEAQEYALIQKTLMEEQGRIRQAAAKLGISHQSILRRLAKWPELRHLVAAAGAKQPDSTPAAPAADAVSERGPH